METTIAATQLAKGLSEILNRVKLRGERFIVQRTGETIARIVPAWDRPGMTLAEFRTRVGDLEMPGDGFADDLEAVQAGQGPVKMLDWPD